MSDSCFHFESLKCDKDHGLDIALSIFILISFVLSLVISIYSQHIGFDGEISKSIADDLIDNFNTGYYTAFAKSTSNIYLSELLEETNENLISFGVWEGTKKGCGKDGSAKVLESGKKCGKDEVILYDIPRKQITNLAESLSLAALSTLWFHIFQL